MLWDVIGQDNSLASLLEQPNITWPQLLAHDTILTQFKNQNKQLLQYLHDHPQVFPQMLTYITVMPQPTDTDLRKFKLPFVSGEILAIESSLIYEAFFGIEDESGSQQEEEKAEVVAEQNLDRLLGFFRQKQLNELLTGYCEKVLYNLFAGRRTQFLQRFFDKYCTDFVQHMSNMNVANIMKKILALEPDKKHPETFKSTRKLTLECLLTMFKIRDRDFKSNLISILTDITSRRLVLCDGEELLRVILEKPELYMDEMAKEIDQEAFRFVKALLFKVNQRQAVEDQDSNIYLSEVFIHMLGLWFVYNLKFLTKNKSSPCTLILNQNKKQVEPLGTARFSLIDAIKEATKMQNQNLNKILVENQVPQRLLSLCCEYPYNGILHSAVKGIIVQLLKLDSVRSMFAVPMLDLVMQTFKQPNQLFFGHLTDIFLSIQSYKDSPIEQKLSMPDVNTFFEDYILPRKQKNQFKWAGNIGKLQAGPHNFIDQEPMEFTSTSSKKEQKSEDDDFFSGASVKGSSKPSWKSQEIDDFGDFNDKEEQKQQAKPATPPPKPDNNFNPFAAFGFEQTKPKPADFSDFGDFAM